MENKIKKYLDAVDVVCLECHYLSEETCETCPVRKTVTEKEDNNKVNISNPNC